LAVCTPQSLGQRLTAARDDNPMGMVRHQTPSQELQAILRSRRREQIQVKTPAFLVKEGLLAVISPLRNMTSDLGDHDRIN
jgi:hypothetical protein